MNDSVGAREGAPAEGPRGGYTGVGTPQKTIQSSDRLYKAPTDYTKPRQTIQSPNRLYKAPTDYTKPQQTIETFEILDNALQY